MAIFFVICGVIVIIGNISNLPAGILMIFQMAFSVKAVGGGLCGTIVASMMNAMRYGVARGVFSNEETFEMDLKPPTMISRASTVITIPVRWRFFM